MNKSILLLKFRAFTIHVKYVKLYFLKMSLVLPNMLVFSSLILVCNLNGQTNMDKRKNSITTDMLSNISKEHREFNLSYEHQLNTGESFVGTIGFSGNQDPNNIELVTLQNTYTLVNSKTCTSIFIFLDCSEDNSYSNGKPLDVPNTTYYTSNAQYLKAGYKYYLKSGKTRTTKMKAYFMPEIILGRVAHNKYIYSNNLRTISNYDNSYSFALPGTGFPWLYSSSSDEENIDYEQTLTISIEEGTELVLGIYGNIGVQYSLNSGLLFGFQGTFGKHTSHSELGRGNHFKLHSRISLNTGFSF